MKSLLKQNQNYLKNNEGIIENYGIIESENKELTINNIDK
jgi:hypothetical protein